MHRQFLLAVLARSPSASQRGLARAALEGDGACLGPLWDCLHEEGVPMMSLKVGQAYLITTVTHYYTGRVKSVSFADVVLGEAAWIPDTGRLSDCLRTDQPAEVEPYPDEVILSTGAIVGAAPWQHPLPREVR